MYLHYHIREHISIVTSDNMTPELVPVLLDDPSAAGTRSPVKASVLPQRSISRNAYCATAVRSIPAILGPKSG
jgi:hypothetical protein